MWEIDRWVVAHAIAVIGERERAGRQTTLLVKITPASLQDDTLVRHIGEMLATHQVPGERLVLELPEAKVFTNLRAAEEFREAVAKFGCRLALEQFGAGLNSFQLLTHFDPALVKIDRSFMQDLATNTEHQQRVRDIAEKARASGKQSIAEFVQEASTMTFLFGCGVDYVQGYFLAPPGPEMNYEFE
jgi:EAL domain-containing protein (putative c-di-GMP-specific phosphodiesterase class I)